MLRIYGYDNVPFDSATPRSAGRRNSPVSAHTCRSAQPSSSDAKSLTTGSKVGCDVTTVLSDENNRIHVDVFVPDDQAAARIESALTAGGRVVYDAEAPEWWTLADPEGNEVDIAVSVGREEIWLAG